MEWKLTEGCNVHGTVLDQAGAPVTQRQMCMRKVGWKAPRYFGYNDSTADTLRSTTDAGGRFRFTDVSPENGCSGPTDRKKAREILADDVAALAQVVEVAEGASDLDVSVRVDRGLFIRGHLFDAKGSPRNGGYVTGIEQATRLELTVLTKGGNNTFALGPLMKGHYVLTTSRYYGDDADSDPVEADAGADDVVLRLKPGGSIEGIVIGTRGDPVHAQLWPTLTNATDLPWPGVWSDNDGDFRFDGLQAGTYNIAASALDGSTGVLEGVVLGVGESKSELSVRLAPGGRVRVRQEGPDRVVNAHVLAHGILYDGGYLERSTTREFTAPAGSVTVRAAYLDSDNHVVEHTVDVKAGQTVDVVFEKDAH